MTRRNLKIAIIIVAIIVIIIGIAVPIYFNFFANKTVYKLVGIEKVNYTVDDLAKHSELCLNENGTFHVQINYQDKCVLSGIGTYTTEGKKYLLKFTQAYARNEYDNIVNYTANCNTDITCTRSGNRIKFDGYKGQTFYFG